MPVYEYVCRDCDASFELNRAMGDADRNVTCPGGHGDVRRKLSVFASIGASSNAGMAHLGTDRPSGGCCGGSCGCGH
jgi:putative FmdB family regulatory protein